MVGSAVIRHLGSTDTRIMKAVRRPPQAPDEILWRPLSPPEQLPDDEIAAFEGIDHVLHLAGENLAQGRWTTSRKKRFRSSRIDATRNLTSLLDRLQRPPRTFVSASAIGGYPATSDDIITESTPFTGGFLGDLCREWESAANSFENPTTRVALLRIGLVLSPSGGVLKKLLPLFRCCLGSRLGSGKQWMSWIDLEDLVQIILLAIADDSISGAINCVAPEPVRNRDFTRLLAASVHRPAAPPIPAPLIRLLYGEMGQALLLEGPKVIPTKLLDSGYRFLRPSLKAALKHQVNSNH